MWDVIGPLQFDFVLQRGLRPDMRFIDIGCGCLRAGVHFVRYLDPGHYHGIDRSQGLLDAGYEQELSALQLQHKLPRQNLVCNANFEASAFGGLFDVALAQSVFTHLPLNDLKLCFTRAAKYTKEGGVFYATVFLSPEHHEWSRPLLHEPGGITSYPDRDPYHYEEKDLQYCINGLPWYLEEITDWSHPRNQKMVICRRLAD